MHVWASLDHIFSPFRFFYFLAHQRPSHVLVAERLFEAPFRESLAISG